MRTFFDCRSRPVPLRHEQGEGVRTGGHFGLLAIPSPLWPGLAAPTAGPDTSSRTLNKAAMKSPQSCALEHSEPARWKSLSGLVWSPVSEGNCVLERGGGEQPQLNAQSVTPVNSIRPAAPASPRLNGEASELRSVLRKRKKLKGISRHG